MAEKQTLDFLWDCSLGLSSQTHTERMLKSYYITTCRKLAKRNVQLPTDTFGTGQMCARCGNQWSDGHYELRMKSNSVAETSKRRRQVAKLEEIQQKGQNTQTLSRGAKQRAKWLKKRMASSVVVDCSLCRHKTMLPLKKPKRKIKQTEVADQQKTIQPKVAATVSKKRKNKKGQNQRNNANSTITTKQTTTKPTPTVKATTTEKKQKGKTKATPPPPPSKTQKKNALLQLAAQLKAHASKDASKTQQNRLQALLK